MSVGAEEGSLPAMTYSEVENASLLYRREKMVSGHVRLRVETLSSKKKPVVYVFTLYFDNDRIRQDQRGGLAGKKPAFEKHLILADGQSITDSRRQTPIAVVIASLDQSPNPREEVGVFHPRSLGMAPTLVVLLSKDDVETVLNRSDFTGKTVSIDSIDGRKVYRLDAVAKSGFSISVWISPEQGFGVVRAKSAGTENGQTIVQVTDSKLREYPQGNVWYPETSVYTLTQNGEELVRQNVTVEEAVFGEAPDPKVFTLAGLNLKPGRPINDQTRQYFGNLMWDGNEVISDSPTQMSPIDDMQGESSLFRRPLLFLNALVCALLAAGLIYGQWLCMPW